MARQDDPKKSTGAEAAEDDFLLREGLDLLAAFRAIRSAEARRAILVMIAAVAQAEREALDL